MMVQQVFHSQNSQMNEDEKEEKNACAEVDIEFQHDMKQQKNFFNCEISVKRKTFWH